MNASHEIAAGSEWLRDRVAEASKLGVVVGLSGGIDSAVTARWAAHALGPERVTLIAMPYGDLVPSRFAPSSPESLAYAHLLAERTPRTAFHALDIAPTVDAEIATTGLASELDTDPENATLRGALANVKARIRAVRLRYFANRYHLLVLGTENRSEHELGYFTIGGDEESDLEILGDFWKSEVVTIARALGVPDEIVFRIPSADLWAGQTDEAELGFSYRDSECILRVVERLKRAGMDITSHEVSQVAADCAVDASTVIRVLRRVDQTAFKRTGKPLYRRTVGERL